MDWKRAKTILLLVLVCANLFLVGNLALQVTRVKGQQRQALKEAMDLLRQDVGEFDDRLFQQIKTQPPAYSYQRSREREKQAAKVLLGTDQGKDEGGGITQFQSAAGMLEFRSGGAMELWLDRGIQGDPAGFFQDLLEEAGFPVDGAQVQQVEEGIQLTQRLPEGELATNCVLLCYEEGNGLHIQGRWLMDTKGAKAGEGRRSYQMVMDLRAFLAQQQIGSPPEQVELVYRVRATGETDGLLAEPMWQVQIGGEAYEISAMTGQALQNGEGS